MESLRKPEAPASPQLSLGLLHRSNILGPRPRIAAASADA
jgi:hypothetical protein